MCIICAMNPNSDALAVFDDHGGTSAPGTGASLVPGDTVNAPYTMDQIATYLTDGYWGFNGGSWRAFDLGPSRVITFDTSRLSPLAAAIVEYALDVWAAATGINFVDAGVAATSVTETSDFGGTTATARAIGTNTIVNATIGTVGDQDYYQVTLVAGQTYMIGMSASDGSSVDSVLRLLNSSGGVLVTADDPSSARVGEYITFTATTTGTYYISASDYGTRTGAYELSIQVASDLTFNDIDATGAYAWSDLSGNSILRSFINVHDSWDTLNLNSYMLQTYIHEIGHALGLGHAGPYNGTATWGSHNLYDNDSWSATIMSYFNQDTNPYDPAGFAYLATIMPADLIAIQNLYGAGSLGYQTGNTVWGPGGNHGGYFQMLLDMWGGVTPANPLIYAGNSFAFMVYDTGGTDTLDFSVFSQNQNISLVALERSSVGGGIGNVVIARGTVIENARGGSGNDTITGNSQANWLMGNGGNDSLYGGGGGDNLWGGAGADAHYGGDGIDYARYDDANWGNLMLRLDNSALNTGAAAVGDTYFGIEGLVGGVGNDTIFGDAQNNWLFGGAGADMIRGGGGNDYLSGDAGSDNLWGGAGADAHYGGDGIDYARYDDANWGNLMLRLDNSALNTGAAAVGDTYHSIEGLVGGVGNDTIFGDANNNWLFGGAGNDMIRGGGGNDYLSGDAGSDNLWGGAGADAHYGGDGIDYARYDDANWGNLTLRLDNSALNAGAAAVGDTYHSIEGLVGGAGNDVIIGDSAANYLFGQGGSDYIDGMLGNDILNGGAGADRFRFSTALGANNVDTIQDFEHGIDKILLSRSIFSAIGATLTADEFRIGMAQDANDFILYNNITGALYYDSNGNAAGGMVQFASLSPGVVLSADDFILV